MRDPTAADAILKQLVGDLLLLERKRSVRRLESIRRPLDVRRVNLSELRKITYCLRPI